MYCAYLNHIIDNRKERKMKSLSARTVLGILLIIFGVLFIADNFELFHFRFHNIFFSWPFFLLIIGIILLINFKNNILGIILVVVGLIALMPRIFPFYGFPHFFRNIFFEFWPIILIVLGVAILLKHGLSKNIIKENGGKGNDSSKLSR